MNLLLDTHVLLWYLAGHSSLSEAQRLAIENRHNQVTVSVASLWEIAIKISLGRLELMDDLAAIETALHQQDIRILAIQSTHLQRLLTLPFHHRDPFDRLIIAQAMSEEMVLVSDDSAFSAYPVSMFSTAA